MTVLRVADYIAEWLARELEAKSVFLVTGAGAMHLTDGLAKRGDLQSVCLHHEQSVSMAVEANSRFVGKIGVAVVSTGPAATNALTGLAGAWQDSVACLFLSGQVKVSESSSQAGIDGLRQFGVQELDILPMVRSVTKYVAQVSDPEHILRELERARYFATEGRPGPVWLEIPLDVQSALINPEELIGYHPGEITSAGDSHSEFPEALLENLESSSRPVGLVGQGVRLSGVSEQLRQLVTRYRIPVVSTYLGVDGYLPHDDLYIGKVGVKGERAANMLVQKSGFLLVLGASMHVSVIGYNYEEFAQGATKWVIDIDGASHRKPTLVDAHFVKSDLKDFIPHLQGRLGGDRKWTDWSHVGLRLKELFPTCLPEYEDETQGVNIYTAVDAVAKRLRPGDVVVSDAGSAFYAVSQAVNLPESTRYLTSGLMASMGYSLPAAIGISVALAEGRVFAFTGDGSLHQNVQELGQMQFLNLPIVLVVLNNAGYLSIRASQRNYFEDRSIGTDEKSGLGLPNITDLATAYNLDVLEISSLYELELALDRALAGRKPIVLNIKCPPDQAIVPTVSSRIEADGSMSSRSLHDRTPLIAEEELEKILGPDWGRIEH